MTKKQLWLAIAVLVGGLVFGWVFVLWLVSRGIWGEGWFRAHAADMPKEDEDEAGSLEREPED